MASYHYLDHMKMKVGMNTDYRPGQPNWENTMWKFQDISATQNLREINFGHFKAQKTAILTI